MIKKLKIIIIAFFQVEATRLGITVTFSHEKEPLGTAGPLAFSRHILAKESVFMIII